MVQGEDFVEILKNDVDSAFQFIEEVASDEQLSELKLYVEERTAEW